MFAKTFFYFSNIPCLYFDHVYPPDFGYGYVAASRFRTMDGIFLYGPIRRTDFIPAVARKRPGDFQMRRSALSDDEDECIGDSAGQHQEAMHRQMEGYSFIVPTGDYDLLSDAGSDGETGEAAMARENAAATMADDGDNDNDLFDIDL